MIGSLAQATSAYKTIAVSNGLSARTIEWVVSSARYLQEFLGDEVQLEDISTQDVKRWILAMRQRRCWTGHPVKNPRPLSATSINNYVRGVKILLSTLAKEGFIPPHPVAGIPAPKPAKVAIKPYSEGELRRIFKSLVRTKHPHRNRAMVGLMFDPCLRLSEVIGLRMADVDLDQRNVVVHGKG
jgi:site-specific recombinase XerD